MSNKKSGSLINMINLENSVSTETNEIKEQLLNESFQSFGDVANSDSKSHGNKLSTSKGFTSRHPSETKSVKKNSKSSINQQKNNSVDISKNKGEEIYLPSIKEVSERVTSNNYFSEFESEFLYLSKSDLTNRLLDILKHKYLGIHFWTFLTIIDFGLRVNIIVYYFYKLFWISPYYYLYLTFMGICRLFYVLIMIKLLFQADFDDIYIERISRNLSFSPEEPKVDFWKKSINVDFEFNLDVGKKKVAPVKTKQEIEYKKLFKYFGTRLFFALCPHEINFFLLKLLYEDLCFSFLILILCSWFYKSVEIFTIIPFLCIFYLYEDWKVGLNYDFITMILLLADLCKTLIIILFLFFSNKRRTRSNTLFLLANKK